MRTISILGVSLYNREEAEILQILEKNLTGTEDILLLPEAFIDTKAYSINDPFIKSIQNLAKKTETHIICPLSIKKSGGDTAGNTVNSALWIDRQGEMLFSYEKVFPYWAEFPEEGGISNVIPGSRAVVFDTDLGKVSLAICFDANFAELWQEIARQGAELVFFVSAYSAGQQLAAHCLNHHYAIVSCTRFPDFAVFDIAGRETRYQRGKKDEVLIARSELDLDQVICHHNFNQEKVQQMLLENPGVKIEQNFEREEWMLLSSSSTDINVHSLCEKYGIEKLRDYQNRSRAYIAEKRGGPFVQGALGARSL
jgi:predicted amidohydrolase